MVDPGNLIKWPLLSTVAISLHQMLPPEKESKALLYVAHALNWWTLMQIGKYCADLDWWEIMFGWYLQ